MVLTLCLVAAVAYGLSDYVGGAVSRGVSAWSVALTGQLTSAVAVLAVSLLVDGDLDAASTGWAAVAGIGNGIGTAFLYRGLAAGRMGVVAPVSAVGAALVPVAVGLATGDRPGLLVGVGLVAAVPGIWLVASEPAAPVAADDGGPVPGARHDPRAGVLDGVVAGLGFGTLFTGLAQIPEEAGLVPLGLNLVVAAVVVAVVASLLRAPWVPRQRRAWLGGISGLLGALATGLFMVATREGELTVAAVVVSLYPAFTVLLAALLLRERVHRTQALGLVLCAVTVALVAAG